jgi:hypothetical protein
MKNQRSKGSRLSGAGLLLQPLYLFVCVCRQVSVHNERFAAGVINGARNPFARAGAALWDRLAHGWRCSNNKG